MCLIVPMCPHNPETWTKYSLLYATFYRWRRRSEWREEWELQSKYITFQCRLVCVLAFLLHCKYLYIKGVFYVHRLPSEVSQYFCLVHDLYSIILFLSLLNGFTIKKRKADTR